MLYCWLRFPIFWDNRKWVACTRIPEGPVSKSEIALRSLQAFFILMCICQIALCQGCMDSHAHQVAGELSPLHPPVSTLPVQGGTWHIALAIISISLGEPPTSLQMLETHLCFLLCDLTTYGLQTFPTESGFFFSAKALYILRKLTFFVM